MRIIGLAGSNSKTSINRQLLNFTASFFNKVMVNLLNLNDYEVEIFSVDKEAENGIPSKISSLAETIDQADLLIISLAEHNSSYTTAFKNVYDWLSRIPNRKVFGETPVLLMAASPGKRGGASVLEAASTRFPIDGSEILSTFSLPDFYDNFQDGEISDMTLRLELINQINNIKENRFGDVFKQRGATCGLETIGNEADDSCDY